MFIQVEDVQVDGTGIFLLTKCTRHDKIYTVLLTSKIACITGKPIISFKEFDKISPLSEFGNQVYFDVTFTAKAFDVLQKLHEKLPHANLAMVVEDEVFAVLTATDRKIINQTFRFQSDFSQILQFKRIHKKLIAKKKD